MIKGSVQYDGGLLLDIILLTLCDYTGNPFTTMKSVCAIQSFLTCLEGLDAGSSLFS